MEKLSRVDRYRDYRNKLNNEAEKEIATKELQHIRDKIILNEKRFGNSSRTESDLNNGRRDTSFEKIINLDTNVSKNDSFSSNETKQSDKLDDIFNELRKYKQHVSSDNHDKSDEYINKIKDLINRSYIQKDTSSQETNKNIEEVKQQEEFIKADEPIKNILYDEVQPLDEPTPIIENEPSQEDVIESQQENIQEEVIESQQENIQEDVNEINDQPKIEEVAEFQEENPVQYVGPQLNDVVIEKPVISIPVPQQDLSKEFREICDAANSLAEEIELSNSFAQEESFVVPNLSPNSNISDIQQDIKKDLIDSGTKDTFMNTLQQEVEQFDGSDNTVVLDKSENDKQEDQNHVIKKSEVSGHLKEEFENTVSLEVNKIMDEINSSKTDGISATDMINENANNKNEFIDDHPGKTIAFEMNKKKDIPDNTVILSNPKIEDSSIHTMSFKTDAIDEKEEKSNTLLNVILSILIIIAVAALGVIVYFFLITRGII